MMCFHITDTVLDGSGLLALWNRWAQEQWERAKSPISFYCCTRLSDKVLGGVCNAEQDSAHGCRSDEHLWRAVLALSVETWGSYSAGNHKPLRAAFVLGKGVGAAVPAGVWCSTGRYW